MMMMTAPRMARPLTSVVSGKGDKTHLDQSQALGALVLARQVGQSIVIGSAIRIEVLALRPGSARLRFVAPRSVPVHRREVYDAIRLSQDSEAIASDQATDSTLDGAAEDAPVGRGLVLSRRVGETTMIGNAIAVEVVETRAGNVRLRVVAPRSISVHRHEVYASIRDEAQV